MATTMENLKESSGKEFEGLIRVPTGCGEQTMSVLMPNVFLAKYLKRLGDAAYTKNNRNKRLKYNIEKGFKRMANYRLKNGSYNTFGENRHPGSTWLTAYIIRGFALASEFIKVDKSLIKHSLEFLDSKQNSDGSLREDGNLIDRQHNPSALTAFVLLAYTENGFASTTVARVAQRYLEGHFERSNDPFTLGLTCYVFTRTGSQRTSHCIRKLNQLAVEPAPGKRCWLDKTTLKSSAEFSAKDIETTGYALLALCNNSATNDLKPVIDWLLSQRNWQFGFQSTQDTAVALNALSEVKPNVQTKSLDVEVEGFDDTHRFTTDSLSPQTYEIPLTQNRVKIRATGDGIVRCQLEYSYRQKQSPSAKTSLKIGAPAPVTVPFRDPAMSYTSEIDLKFKLTAKDDENNILQLRLCPSYKGNVISGNIMVEIEALTGYKFDEDAVSELQKQTHKGVQKVECAQENQKCYIYMEKIDSGMSVCLPLKLLKSSDTRNAAGRTILAHVKKYFLNYIKILQHIGTL
ncbi:CD109 antigen-like isoform X2 [Paramacrobiotus metropolitanus]|nr:CD109 antigen-like isoform X2 [Paramacrobiotus metropolitanus]